MRCPAASSPPTSLTTTAPRSSPASPARPAAPRRPASPSTRAGRSPTAYDGALFFADYSRDCIWVMFPGGNGLPDREQPGDVPGSGRESGRPADRPRRRALLRRLRRRHDPADRVRRQPAADRRRPPRSPTNGPAPLTVNFDGSGSTDPEGGPLTTPGTSTATARSTTRPASRRSHTYTRRRTYNVRLRVTDTAATSSATSAPVTISGEQHAADGDDRRAGGSGRLGGWATRSPSRARRRIRSRAPCPPSALSWELICSTARRTATRTACRPARRRERIVLRAGPRVPVPPRASADGDRRRRPDGHERHCGSTHGRSTSAFRARPRAYNWHRRLEQHLRRSRGP